MSAEEFIGEILLGVFIIFIGYQIGYKGNIRLVHSYHYGNIEPKDIKQFTKKMGIGTMCVGIGIILMPIINCLIGYELGYYFGLVLVIIGVIMMMHTILKYNRVLFSLKK